MAKGWYPVVDYTQCIECATCIEKCPHGVYDIIKAPVPVVSNPDSCIDHCHGCGNLCPQGAITYVGDDTGWQPPGGKQPEDEPCCDSSSGCDCGGSCSATPDTDKTLTIDFLYLDLKTCERCMGTEEILISAIDEAGFVLKSAGYCVTLNKVEIKNEVLARQYRFLSSPTIRINGKDICMDVKENCCAPCSDISSQSVDCRIFVYEGKEYEVPPKAMIINAILKAVYSGEKAPDDNGEYILPENLKRFFEGKRNNNLGCCGECC